MKALLIPGVMLVVGTAWVVLLWSCGSIGIDRAVELWVGVALVCVTLAYVLLTRDILSESRQTGLVVKDLAASTADLAKAAGEQADAARRTLSHLQRPVLVLRVLGDVGPDEEQIPLQVQNVGEGAAIWPKVNFAHHGPRENLLGDHPPHILPPQQFSEDVPQRQRIRVPKPDGGSTEIRLECDDPRTGEKVSKPVWRLYTEDGVKWYAGPVGHGEDSCQ